MKNKGLFISLEGIDGLGKSILKLYLLKLIIYNEYQVLKN
jgi:thymidylate kinase